MAAEASEVIVYTKAATINDIGMTFSKAIVNKLIENGAITTTCTPDELNLAFAEAGKTIVVYFGTAPRSRKPRVPCDHPGCSTRPNYGKSGGIATKCSAHKEEGMVNVTIEKRTKVHDEVQSADEVLSTDEVQSTDESKKVEKTPKKRAPRKPAA
jgi:hypothetical protein